MAFKGSDNSKFCGGNSEVSINPVSYVDDDVLDESLWQSEVMNPVSYDNDDVPLSERLSQMSSSRTWSSIRDAPVNKRCNRATRSLPIKRPFGNSSSLNITVKKKKVSPFENPRKDKDDTPLSRSLAMPVGKSVDKSLFSLKKELILVEKSIDECKKKKQEEEERLQSIKKDIEECSKVLENKKKEISCVERTNISFKKIHEKIDQCIKDFAAKQAHLCFMDDLIGKRKQEINTKETELRSIMDNIDKVCEGKEQKLKALSQKFDQCNVELKAKEKERDAMKELIDGQADVLQSERMKLLQVIRLNKNDARAKVKDFESTKKQFEDQVKNLELMEKRCKEREGELDTKEKLFEGRVKELEKQHEDRVMEFKSDVEKFHGQMKELESEKKHLDSRMKDLKSEERRLEGRAKQVELKEEQFKGQEEDLAVRVKELESEKIQFEGRLEDHRSKEKFLEDQLKEFEDRVKKFESKEEEFKAKMQKLKRFVSQMEDSKSDEKQFEEQGKERGSKDKELEQKEKQFDGCVTDLVLREKQSDALIEPSDEEMELGNQSSPSSEQNNDLELVDILVNLQVASDPSKFVLEKLQDPVIQKCKTGDGVVIIDDRHILLLEELRRISPDISPHVREEAMKLALDLKAGMKENNENSSVALCFLLVLSIYGLVPSFDEDDVFKLFELVSKYNIAVELFGDMGFADKISDFVENLIKRQQYDEAVRFSRAYNLSDNNQLFDLFKEHMKNLKLIYETRCKEIKNKAKNQEVASLIAVLRCIIDNKLQFQDLLDKIDDRILELKT